LVVAKVDVAASLDLVKSYGLTEVETAGTGNLTTEQYLVELQKRGLFRTEYEGKTLRENLGLRRPGSRYKAVQKAAE
jgi:hypothetical protein